MTEPGAPTFDDNDAPGSVSTDPKIEFSYFDLELTHCEKEENGDMFLIFLVRNEFEIAIPKWNFYEYQDIVFTRLAEIGAKLTTEDKPFKIMDLCTPPFEKIEGSERKIHGFLIDIEDKTTTPQTKEIAVYEVFNLINSLTVEKVYDK